MALALGHLVGQPLKKGVVMEKLKRRTFTAEFKIEAVKLVTHSGLSYAEVGRRLDILPKLIKAWEDTYCAGKLIADAPRLRVTPEQMELSKLRKEIQELKMERDILMAQGHVEKAAAYFARMSK